MWHLILSNVFQKTKNQADSEDNHKNVHLWGETERTGDIQTRKEKKGYNVNCLQIYERLSWVKTKTIILYIARIEA